MVCGEVVCERWTKLYVGGGAGGGGGGEHRDTESKTRTPHKVVGKKKQKKSFDPWRGPEGMLDR